MKHVLTLILLASYFYVSASIYCPPNKTLMCNADVHYLYITGKATAVGYPESMVKYTDVSFQDQCNVGYINRIWYIDLNQDGVYQSSESSCTQVLTLTYIPSTISVNFPEDKIYTCKEEIMELKPTWVSGPCDVMGYNVEDAVFDVAPDACYKIFRKFTVLNWCKYKPTDPNWDGSGIWTHTQVIKVIEKTPPMIQDCTDRIVGVDADCKASLTFKNKAFDDVLCPSEILSWVVEIDLWADGTNDYRYGFTETAEFYIKPVGNGQEISFTLPERVGVGKHKIYWSVRDQCGNFKTCHTIVETKDLKKPTPYANIFMTASFEADTVGFRVPASLFNIGSTDNCTPTAKLRYSFSPNVNDTIRVINCTNAGFQFFTIYVTDLSGNNDFVNAFMIVYDNGSCNTIGNFNGTVSETNGRPLQNVNLTLFKEDQIMSVSKSNEVGNFEYLNESLYDQLSIKPSYYESDPSRLNIADFKKLQNYILGRDQLVNFEYFAADLNQDSKIKIEDLVILRDKILGVNKSEEENWKFMINQDSIASVSDLPSLNSLFNIMDWRGKIAFKAVYNGDISSANHILAEPRSTIWVSKWNENGALNFTLESDIVSEGLQLEFDVPVELLADIEINSKYFKSTGNHVFKDYKNGKIKLLVPDNMNISKDEPMVVFSASEESLLEAVSLHKAFILTDGYRLNVVQERTMDKNELNNDILFVPNPNHGRFQVIGKYDNLVSVINSLGQHIEYRVDKDGSVQIDCKGLVYVSLKKGKQIITKKVIIID